MPIKNVDLLSDKIMYYLEHKNEALEMGVRAKDRVNREYSMPSVWNKMLNIWNSLL